MKLEDQVVSFELAKKLHLLGVHGESLYHWALNHKTNNNEILTDGAFSVLSSYEFTRKYAAFTAAELGEMLPFVVKIDGVKCYLNAMVGYTDHEYSSTLSYSFAISENCDEIQLIKHDIDAPTEAEARARMLIYLLESGIIKSD